MVSESFFHVFLRSTVRFYNVPCLRRRRFCVGFNAKGSSVCWAARLTFATANLIFIPKLVNMHNKGPVHNSRFWINKILPHGTKQVGISETRLAQHCHLGQVRGGGAGLVQHQLLQQVARQAPVGCGAGPHSRKGRLLFKTKKAESKKKNGPRERGEDVENSPSEGRRRNKKAMNKNRTQEKLAKTTLKSSKRIICRFLNCVLGNFRYAYVADKNTCFWIPENGL